MRTKSKPNKAPETYRIETNQNGEVGIFCGWCHKTSYNPNDIKFLYCGNCHHFFDPKPGDELKPQTNPSFS